MHFKNAEHNLGHCVTINYNSGIITHFVTYASIMYILSVR